MSKKIKLLRGSFGDKEPRLVAREGICMVFDRDGKAVKFKTKCIISKGEETFVDLEYTTDRWRAMETWKKLTREKSLS